MKPFEKFIMRHGISLPIMTAVFPVLYLGAEIGIIASGAVAAGSYIASSSTIKQFQFSSDSKRFHMTRSEYKHIRIQLKEAKAKIKQLQGHYYRVRSISYYKQIREMVRISQKIVTHVQQNPRQFYLAEPFFYSHLDSALELTEKYTLLVGQPIKDKELKIALQDTRDTLGSMIGVMETDLKKVLSTDVEQLRMELEYAQMTLEKHNTQALPMPTQTDSEGDMENDRKPINSK
ncbi:5-bromo-4-chloroindolyl phosphate hydrolysis family protein [Planococcus shixiaomingii]|uniref:5-bromo-4-chloroindolyl phosphate hydrolysis family protein n=1 Tax=Planococcus shixiaomingii TaxID=3058393 RepID=UPI00262A641F|nr:5-bromo-4-chloroindolyl phosphate hydrolysis family protein [Planococcus sp. N022]WKA53267.1 5-bromo-4-chloroindolyl phosphate hydrolysis family protein [Planococcus sp. N022]